MASPTVRAESAVSATAALPADRPAVHIGMAVPALAAAAALVGVSYQSTFLSLAELWQTHPRYPFGYLVPVLCLAVAAATWRRNGSPARYDVPAADVRAGLFVLIVGLLAHLSAVLVGQVPLDIASLVLVVRGAVRIFGGRALMQAYAPAILLLLYLIPVPGESVTPLVAPFQHGTALGAAALLDLATVPVFLDGTVLQLNDFTMVVTSAMSGLRELEGVLAICLAVALMSERGWAFKTTMIALSLPLAAGVGIARFTAAGIGFHYRGRAAAEHILNLFNGPFVVVVAVVLVCAAAIFLGGLGSLIPRKWSMSR
jgi:exosortase